MTFKREYVKNAEGLAGDSDKTINKEVRESVHKILEEVRESGDEAIRKFTKKFDNVYREDLKINNGEIEEAKDNLSEEDRKAINYTIDNVRRFHEAQRDNLLDFEKEFKPGVRIGLRFIPIETTGVYIPGGRYPLVASPVMLIVPAVISGVEKIVACAPPQKDGSIIDSQLYAMNEAGADEIYCVGGAQAIGAMTYGTNTVPKVSKITGPGNIYTQEAKRQVFGEVGIDFLAGPSEVLIIADDSSDPDLIATDLLAQAEHDPRSRPVLVSTAPDIAQKVLRTVEEKLPKLKTEKTAKACWENNGEVIVVDDIKSAVEVANEYAMEHVQVMTEEPRSLLDDLSNYGSLFLGEHSPVVFGDKSVGSNHVLPTGRTARFTGGIWAGTYLKALSHQELTDKGAREIAHWAEKICELEGTHAHKLSAKARSSHMEEDKE
ncbi:histidinol dehydrogenase [candidate division MSBL1 archaeon SCGC-AAA259J03]|uniref:Histidinol dehydrogenase n=1 Tax=candidate division MSBL1 archaeon SCGC-AAA259J03 TaxID=1698269 RepID=A0A656YV67_9EURY|nr:histidinol dehydrogenase [candidate division MSBL1 archaeon SCGC-AAA259J03]